MPAEPAYVPRMSPSALMTAEELLHVRIPDKRVELVRGKLVVREPAGYTHGRVAMNLTVRLGAHVERTGAGQLFAAETGFTLARGPDTVRAPDIAFIRRARLPDPEPVGFPDLAPDLVVEVLSPSDRPGEVLAKVADWLSADVPLIWVIDPKKRVAHSHSAPDRFQTITEGQSLTGGDVLPGFALPLKKLFARQPSTPSSQRPRRR